MKICSLILLLFSAAGYLPIRAKNLDEATLRADAQKVFKDNVSPFVKKYCTRCHGSRAKAGINLQSALKNPVGSSASLHWKKAIANVEVRDMPPEDSSKIPSNEERLQFINGVKKIKYLAPRDPGPFVIRRLTKTEYANTLRDLYGVDTSIADSLPDEINGEGFLNSISPLQSELYLVIASKLIDQVISPEGKAPTSIQKTLFGEVVSNESNSKKDLLKTAKFLTRKAFRRPPTMSELDVLINVYNLGLKNNLNHLESLGLMLKAVLVSPQLLFITPSAEFKSNEKIVSIDSYQLASRLSYLLWSSPPDQQLANLADEATLINPEVLKEQVNRMLNNPKSKALFDGFGAQWLRLNNLENQVFDMEIFPDMTLSLRMAMIDEARLFFRSIIKENKSVIEFVDSDYTFLNEQLSKLYGITESVIGEDMRRVKLTNPNRGGIIGMPATLASTSFSNRTSPVRRGVWVLEQVLGERVPSPPPDIPELEELDHENEQGLTLRQRTELHQSEATCANCHKLLDPIGFGLENFDAIGRWREVNNEGLRIDSSGQLPNGEKFTSPALLKSLLIKRKGDLARNFTEKFMAHALGRQLEGYDYIVIDQLMDKISADDYRIRTIITEVITSYLFTHRRVEG
tara:strand:+ start:9758 stop:11647 length:1890 start_codon:yes stop_codon:yes gene_type:complete